MLLRLEKFSQLYEKILIVIIVVIVDVNVFLKPQPIMLSLGRGCADNLWIILVRKMLATLLF